MRVWRSISASATGWSRDLGSQNAMILRNHGLLVGGPTASQTWNWIYFLERACEAQIKALSGGVKLVLPPEEVRRHTERQANHAGPDGHALHQELAWAASLRLIENAEPDYRS